MKKIAPLMSGFVLVLSAIVLPVWGSGIAHATGLASESFTSVSTTANAWLSGGSGSVACLTAASSAAANSIPNCGAAIDSPGDGALRLTPATNARSGYAIYNTPISAGDGLEIGFDMYQYRPGTGPAADGISFFLIDGASSPTQPGASGGSLGYSSGGITPGIVGGYVGIGFDFFGNFSSSGAGTGGTGALANSIGVRGSEATGYQFVGNNAADGQLAVSPTSNRNDASRHVKVTISTGNIMTVAVDYGSGYVTELSNLDLNTINGAGSLPATFKFGFAASTGGFNNIHEISGFSVATLRPNVSVNVASTGTFQQGGTGHYTLSVSNDAGAEATTGTITVTDTLPAGLTPTSASGTGWSCTIVGQLVTCTRPGSGGAALGAGQTAPVINLTTAISSTAAASLNNTATVTTADNSNATPSDTDTVSVAAGSSRDSDGMFDAVELAAPNAGDANNDGTADADQDNVTALPDPVSGHYAVLEASGCGDNTNVSVAGESANAAADGSYSYPAGLMNFTLTCGAPGSTATVTQYYYGNFDLANLVMRKYNAVTHTYQNVPGAAISLTTIGGLPAIKAVYQITDGGPLDQDGVANGTIVDPAGPAVLAAATSSGPGVPNTGLATQSQLLPTLAGLLGLGLFIYVSRRPRRAQGSRAQDLRP